MNGPSNAEVTAKPTATAAVRTGSQLPERLVIPQIPGHLFPITSQEDLLLKLLAASSSRPVSTSPDADALPVSNRAPDRTAD